MGVTGVWQWITVWHDKCVFVNGEIPVCKCTWSARKKGGGYGLRKWERLCWVSVDWGRMCVHTQGHKCTRFWIHSVCVCRGVGVIRGWSVTTQGGVFSLFMECLIFSLHIKFGSIFYRNCHDIALISLHYFLFLCHGISHTSRKSRERCPFMLWHYLSPQTLWGAG